jgi:protein-disulfide isomerase
LSERSKKVLLAAVVLVAAGLAAVLIAVSMAGGKDEPSAGTVHGVAETQALLEGIPQQGNVLGKPGAPVTIVEYADYQCPFCARWAVETLPAVVDEYVRPGNVKIVFQGIAILGDDSVTALQAAVSAGMQDKLWNVGELLFHNQGAENSGWVTDDLLRDIGASVPGLDVDAMMDGRKSAEVADAIGAPQADAQAGGITGTPWFEITKTGGQPTLLQGAQPIDEFRQVLDGMLQDS